uniref:OrfB_Zn_ribbon domain-containing protein n=1 Tax=Panagrellus redivivus TaxID=6233 RepID=A0A7E4ZXA9_PANRE
MFRNVLYETYIVDCNGLAYAYNSYKENDSRPKCTLCGKNSLRDKALCKICSDAETIVNEQQKVMLCLLATMATTQIILLKNPICQVRIITI